LPDTRDDLCTKVKEINELRVIVRSPQNVEPIRILEKEGPKTLAHGHPGLSIQPFEK